MENKYRLTHFLPLIAVLAASLTGIILFKYDNALKISLICAMGVSYFVWGIIHHYINRDINAEIVVEYLSVAVFGATAALFLIL